MTVALPYEAREPGPRGAPAALLERLEEIGVEERVETAADPENTDSPLLFHLERGFGAADAGAAGARRRGLVLMRSAGERGEAEAIAPEVARLLAEGVEPEQIAIVARDPARRGPLLASVLESYGVAGRAGGGDPGRRATAVGGALVALLEALLGTGRAADLLRYLRGPSGVPPGRVDWFERRVRRERIVTAATRCGSGRRARASCPTT